MFVFLGALSSQEFQGKEESNPQAAGILLSAPADLMGLYLSGRQIESWGSLKIWTPPARPSCEQ